MQGAGCRVQGSGFGKSTFAHAGKHEVVGNVLLLMNPAKKYLLKRSLKLSPSESHIFKTVSQELCPSDGRSRHIPHPAKGDWFITLPARTFHPKARIFHPQASYED